MASTYNPIVVVDDSGDPDNPVGDGTQLNSIFFAMIEAILNEFITRSTKTVGGVWTWESPGIHLFSASVTGVNGVRCRNTAAGAGNAGVMQVASDHASHGGTFQHLSTTFTPSGIVFADQTILQSDGDNGLLIRATSAVGTAVLRLGAIANIRHYINSTERTDLFGAANTFFVLSSRAAGTGAIGGNQLQAGRNSSGNGAAGNLALVRRDGNVDVLWFDAGTLRTLPNAIPTENDSVNHTGGTIVGTQTSSLDTKDVQRERTDLDAMLEVMLQTRVYDFKYKASGYRNEIFTGVVTDEAPAFGMDQDAAHPNGRSLNPVNALGYTVAAVRALEGRLRRLEERLSA